MIRVRPAAPRLVAVLGVLALLAGCAAATTPGTTSATGGSLDSAVGSVPHRSVAPMPTARLAAHLTPPTNRWFSGLVFGAAPQPVFPLPLSFALTGSGFSFGVPAVTTEADTITGGFLPAISVDDRSASSTVTGYDAASVTIQQRGADGRPIGSVVIAEGSPVVSYTALKEGTVSLGTRFEGSGRVRVATVDGRNYGLVTTGSLSGTELHLTKGQTVALFAAPDGVSAAQFGSHVSMLSGVSLDDSVGSSTVTTTLHYRSAGETVVAAMPHQTAGLRTPGSCSQGAYPSVYGSLAVCSGPTLSWTSPKTDPSARLDGGALSDKDSAELTAQLATDIQATPALPTDSYFGGKALYRLANLLMLAHQLGDGTQAAAAQSKLDAALVKWTDPHGCSTRSSECFVYDPTVKGVVGLGASFGSDQFNDHAFHYGYFLYAAGVAARYEPSLTSKIQPVIDLLAADIGTAGGSSAFPTRRVFDAYAGHSWASGYAPFADGNNQESSSEAVNAWNGLALWGAATGNKGLTSEATWMLSAEAASAKAYWTNFPTTGVAASGYRHSVVGINWGGKRDFATWFSADAGAKLGIQLIPMGPVSSYLAGDPKRIAQNVAEAAPGGVGVQFGDYLLMYSALEGSQQAATALATARSLPSTSIDDADSRSYLLAWIMARR
ncbi:glycosyl hydrolase [Lysinimonas soli]|uniref:glucan endo-1,3-beta-D-glucosidase n=1 Tax=Lysinimonas soli TaxID=1074233 RepID=A0ABW0NLA2_9MICO